MPSSDGRVRLGFQCVRRSIVAGAQAGVLVPLFPNGEYGLGHIPGKHGKSGEVIERMGDGFRSGAKERATLRSSGQERARARRKVERLAGSQVAAGGQDSGTAGGRKE